MGIGSGVVVAREVAVGVGVTDSSPGKSSLGIEGIATGVAALHETSKPVIAIKDLSNLITCMWCTSFTHLGI